MSHRTTLRELLVAYGILLVFLLMAYAVFVTFRSRGNSTSILSQMRQVHMATQQMTLDEKVTGGNVSWTCEKGVPFTRSNFTNYLVTQTYLQADDMHKLLVAGKKNFWGGYDVVEDAYHIYAIDDSDLPSTVLLATKNWHGLTNATIYGDPYDKHGFVVFRKGGDGAVLQEKQATNEGLIGTGGRFNFQPLK